MMHKTKTDAKGTQHNAIATQKNVQEQQETRRIQSTANSVHTWLYQRNDTSCIQNNRCFKQKHLYKALKNEVSENAANGRNVSETAWSRSTSINKSRILKIRDYSRLGAEKRPYRDTFIAHLSRTYRALIAQKARTCRASIKVSVNPEASRLCLLLAAESEAEKTQKEERGTRRSNCPGS